MPLLPYDAPLYDTMHAIGPRLLLDASAKEPLRRLALAPDAPPDDVDLRHHVPDFPAHTMHSALLASELPAGRTCTVPQDCEWPVTQPAIALWSRAPRQSGMGCRCLQ